MTAMAAALREGLWLLAATSSGYMSAWGWCRPMRTSSEWMSRRTGRLLVWMRAMSCGEAEAAGSAGERLL